MSYHPPGEGQPEPKYQIAADWGTGDSWSAMTIFGSDCTISPIISWSAWPGLADSLKKRQSTDPALIPPWSS